MSDADTSPLTVATYTTAACAHLAKSVLEGNGIQTAVVGDQIDEALGYFGVAVTKVELLVRRPDAAEARRLLAAFEQESRMGWLCDDCSEINEPNFDEYWSCAASRQRDADIVPLPDSAERNTGPSDLMTAPENPDSSPYRVPHIENRPDTGTELVDRTFRSAVLGPGIPPLAPYSFSLACRCVGEGHPMMKVWTAMMISSITMLVWLAILFPA